MIIKMVRRAVEHGFDRAASPLNNNNRNEGFILKVAKYIVEKSLINF